MSISFRPSPQFVRTLLALAVALVTAAFAVGVGSAADARTATPVSVRLDFFASPHHAGFYVAKAKGWYSQAGLDVTINEGTGSSTTAQVVASGSDTFGFIAADILARAVATGAPLMTVAMPIQDSGLSVVVNANSGITSLKQLEGKTFADTITGVGAQLFPAVLENAGVDPSKVRIQNIGGGAKFGALYSGRVDAIGAPGFLPTFLSNYGANPIRTFAYRGSRVPTLGWGIVVKRDFLQANPNAVRAFVRETLRGYAWAFSNPRQAHQMIASQVPRYTYREQDAVDMARLTVKHTANTQGKPLGWMSVRDWGSALRLLKARTGFDSVPSAQELYTNKYLPTTPLFPKK
jgi:NitT/TauT family transport system substrate-binding protein